jgi:hypothetical protein
MSVPSAIFGPGILILTRTDVATPIAINVGYVQEFSFDASGTTKQLYGQNQWPLVAARGTIKATGKFKAATVSGIAANIAFYGMSGLTASTSATRAWNVGSTFTISTTSATVAVGSSLTFDADLGVTYAGTGLPLQRVSTGSEATGKYSVGATTPNNYTFGGTDISTTGGVNIKVTYTSTTGSGQIMQVTNQLIGTSPTFQLDYYTNLDQPSARPFGIRLYACIAAKHVMTFKLEDFMIPEWDFDVFANAAGNVYDMVYPEVA